MRGAIMPNSRGNHHVLGFKDPLITKLYDWEGGGGGGEGGDQ